MKKVITTLLLSLLVPGLAFAAGTDVQMTTGSTVVLTVGSSALNFTVTRGNLESITVNASSVDLVLASGSGLDITSADKKTFTYGGAPGITSSFACNSSSSVLSLDGSGIMTVTPSEATCSTSSGSGGGGSGGGGGGGSSTPAPEPTPAPVSTPAPAATPAPALATVVATVPAASVAKPSVIASVVSPVFNKLLQVGSRSDDVKRLQQLLAQDKEIYPDGSATGYFGKLTATALRKFQLKYGVIKKITDPGNGTLGPKTRAKLKEIFEKGVPAPVSTPVPAPVVAPAASAVSSTKSMQDQLTALLKTLQELQAKAKR